MPVGALIVGGGTALGGALIGANASNKASDRQADAALEAARISAAAGNRAADMQLGMFNTIRDDLSPYRSIGGAAVSPYMNLLGLGSPVSYGVPSAAPVGGAIVPAMAGGGAPVLSNSIVGGAPAAAVNAGTPASGGDPDWNAYLQAYPDVAAEYQRQLTIKNGPKSLAEKGITDPLSYAAWHYNTMGKNEGRQMSLTPLVPATPATPVDPNGNGVNQPFVDPNLTPTQVQQNMAAAQAQNSANIQFSLENLPGYKFARQQGIDATTNALSAKGLGGAVSGAYAKGLARFVTGLADSTYGSQVDRLSNAVGIGQSAANQTGAYGQSAASGAGQNMVGAANAGASGIVGAANAGAAGQIGTANALAGGLTGLGNAAITSRALGMYGNQTPTFSAGQANTLINSNPNLF